MEIKKISSCKCGTIIITIDSRWSVLPGETICTLCADKIKTLLSMDKASATMSQFEDKLKSLFLRP